ncbi:MAG: hypothetical protein M3Z21_15155 [Pseudomonadota bacterium]|nr:hypothetical protein [Pseudomonadota bacterium]
MADKIGLVELLAELRWELVEAQNKAATEKLKFEVEDIDLELQVVTTKTGESKFGVKFWVLDAEAKGAVSSQAMQTIRLKLKPTQEGGDVLVSDEDEK